MSANPRAWFASDPLDGVSFFATEAEARAQAEAWLDEERDNAADDGWGEDVESICYGRVTGYIVQTKDEEAPEGSHHERIADYALVEEPAVPASPPLAESTTIVHPDDGDGPWIQPPRMVVPRGAVGRRVRVVVMGDEPGD